MGERGTLLQPPLSFAPLLTPVRIHFHSGVFIYAGSPVDRSGILDLSEA